MIAARAIALAMVAGALLAGCNCRKERDAPAKTTAVEAEDERPERDRPTTRRAAPTPPDPARDRVRPAPMPVEDAIGIMPRLDVRELAPPATAPSGNQIRFTYCVDGTSAESAASTLQGALERDGWAVTTRAPGAAASPRWALAAEKQDHRLSVTVQAVRRTGCDATVNQFFAVASLSKIQRGAPPPP